MLITLELSRLSPPFSLFLSFDLSLSLSLSLFVQAYSVYDREVGYCQGSPFITGLLLMQVRGVASVSTEICSL